MFNFHALPTNRPLLDFSLWSADLTRLAEEIQRTEPFADLYHFDVADAHFVPGLLFFPDLVAALRPMTRKPFHIHLMVENPLNLVNDFARAGADILTIHVENDNCAGLLEEIHAQGCCAGLCLKLETPVETCAPCLERADLLLLMGTELGVKGVGLAPQACPRLRAARRLIQGGPRGEAIRLQADGGIRAHTAADLRAAGADILTPGSLVFRSPDLAEMTRWLHGLATT